MLQIFLIIESFLIIACIASGIFFSSKYSKKMFEWRARKTEIANLLQERKEKEEEIKKLKSQEQQYSNQINSYSLQLSSIERERIYKDVDALFKNSFMEITKEPPYSYACND